MIYQKEIVLPAYPRGFHLIGRHIREALEELPEQGLIHLYKQHTSAALAINEGADPNVRSDLEQIFNRLVPENHPYYTHVDEGPDDMPSHAKAIMTGASLNIPVSGRKLALGTWQEIYLCEFRNNGGRRKVLATIIS